MGDESVIALRVFAIGSCRPASWRLTEALLSPETEQSPSQAASYGHTISVCCLIRAAETKASPVRGHVCNIKQRSYLLWKSTTNFKNTEHRKQGQAESISEWK